MPAATSRCRASPSRRANPFLGLRGIRLSLGRPEMFRVQIRALLRAAVHGKLKVMFPMVAVAAEYRARRGALRRGGRGARGAGIPMRMPPLGIMVEVPAVAHRAGAFADVAFFSIGSNDLTQYVMAAARDNGARRGAERRAPTRRCCG